VPVHTPLWQLSGVVQALPSVQVVPSGLFGLEHTPVAGLQVPGSWHWFSAVHTTGFVPVQIPAWQLSVCVQRSPSLQPEPFGLLGLEQRPVAGAQVPAAWHWSSGVHTIGLLPTQVPLWQTDVCVHRLVSVHVLPFGLLGFGQIPVPGLQVPGSWH
jgi:hypothetical protein